jgi:hypothetical protein
VSVRPLSASVTSFLGSAERGSSVVRSENSLGGVDTGDHGGFLSRGSQVIAGDLDWFIGWVAIEKSLEGRVIPDFALVRRVRPSSEAACAEVATKFSEEALYKVADDSDQAVIAP